MSDNDATGSARDARQIRVMLAAANRANDRLRDLTAAPWLVEEWDVDGDVLTFFARYITAQANYPTMPDAYAAGFLCALEIAADPHIGRPTLTAV